MFMSPREIGDYVTQYGDLPAEATGMQHDKAGRYKVENAMDSGMYRSIEAEGVKKPVEIAHFGSDYPSENQRGQRALANGHHRTFSQAQADPDRLMPVIHNEGWQSGGETAAFPVTATQDEDPDGTDRWTASRHGWHKIRP